MSGSVSGRRVRAPNAIRGCPTVSSDSPLFGLVARSRVKTVMLAVLMREL